MGRAIQAVYVPLGVHTARKSPATPPRAERIPPAFSALTVLVYVILPSENTKCFLFSSLSVVRLCSTVVKRGSLLNCWREKNFVSLCGF